jgi:thioredoxin reductase (NADPH)
MQTQLTDIAIIGAGPTGLFAVFEAGMLKMRCHVIDSLDAIGGQCTALYPEKPIYDIPAYPVITAQELISCLEAQAAPFNPVYHLGQQVISIQEQNGSFTLTTSKGTVIEAKAVIIASGAGAFGPNRPPLDKIENYEGTSVFYAVQQKENFRDKRIVIAGGGDSAIDWALSLAPIAAKVYLIHRRAKFRCAPESLDKIHALEASGHIEMVVPYQLDALVGEAGKLKQVVVKDLDEQRRALDADILLPFFGLAMDLGPITNWGLNIDYHHIQVDPATLATNIAGIHAIGDIVTYPGKLKLILNGFGEAAMACHAIYPRVHPDQALHFEYSTSKGVVIA